MCHLGLEKATAEKIWVCRKSLKRLCLLLHQDDVDKEG